MEQPPCSKLDRNISKMETFKYSIIYLMALFVVMLVDHYLFPVSTL